MVKVIIFLTLLSNLALGQKVIVWNQDKKLTWNDFKGKPHNSTSAAATYCGIETKINKRNFWTGKLTIEGHFDIAEWYARKLRKVINDNSQNGLFYTQNFDHVYKENHIEYLQTQTEYELQTGYGTLEMSQMAWEQKIILNLQQLEEFNRTPLQPK